MTARHIRLTKTLLTIMFLICGCFLQAATLQVPEWFRLSARLDRAPELNQAVELLAGQYPLVPLRLDLFDIPEEVRMLLPLLYVRIRGAFPFARLGHSLQVALLNPADGKLQEEVEALAGMPCTFFLAHPAHVGGALAAYPIPETE